MISKKNKRLLLIGFKVIWRFFHQVTAWCISFMPVKKKTSVQTCKELIFTF